MKNLLLFIVLLFISVPSTQAQDDATKWGYSDGDSMIGGTLSIVSVEDGIGATTIAPYYAKMVSDNWAVYGAITYAKVGDASGTTFGVGARNYFLDLGKTDVYLSMGVAINTGDIVDVTTISSSFGLDHHITDKIALTFSLAPLASYVTGDDATNTFTFGFGNVGNMWATSTFGLQFKL